MPKGLGYGRRRRAPRLAMKAHAMPKMTPKGMAHRTILSPGGNISRSAPSAFRIRPQNAV